MRLINTKTLEFEEFSDELKVKYAILSHRWEHGEVLYKDFSSGRREKVLEAMPGYHKLESCCREAAKARIKYVWIDTCCIDKSSSAELQEAINSMYRWYEAATICYAYLSDVPANVNDKLVREYFLESQWFRRGWTLQELLAPGEVVFYDREWNVIDTRSQLILPIHEVTGIPTSILASGFPKNNKPCIAEIMSWARGRETTRIEDRAYSLVGLFDVSMPMLYGEGHKAFLRLQEEILKQSEDQSIFAWQGVELESPGLLAKSPDVFGNYLKESNGEIQFDSSNELERRKPHLVTNEGISLELQMCPVDPNVYLALLNIQAYEPFAESGRAADENCAMIVIPVRPGIYLKRVDKHGRYARVAWGKQGDLAWYDPQAGLIFERRQITVVRQLRDVEKDMFRYRPTVAFRIDIFPHQSLSWYDWQATWKVRSPSSYDAGTKMIGSIGARYECRPGIVAVITRFSQASPLEKFPIRTIVLGLDYDYCPVCIFSNMVLDGHSKLVKTIVDMRTGLDDHQEAEDLNQWLRLDGVVGGTGGTFGREIVAIKANPTNRDDGSGFQATLKMSFNAKRWDWLLVTISRRNIIAPWDFRFDVTADGEFEVKDKSAATPKAGAGSG